MIYSIAVLDICDFDAIGRKIPKGTGVDATVDNGATAPKHKKRKRPAGKTVDSTATLVQAFENSEIREDWRYALKVLLEFGTATEKVRAQKELSKLAFESCGSPEDSPQSEIEDSNSADEDDDDYAAQYDSVW
jgi:hypothetical protein